MTPKQLRPNAKEIVELRKELGISRNELARRVGISGPSMLMIEHGNTKQLKGGTLFGLASVFKVPPVQLVQSETDESVMGLAQRNMTNGTWFERIRERLNSLSMKQVELAQATGLSPGRIGNYLQGKREPALEEFKKLISAIGVTADWILFGGPNQPSSVHPSGALALAAKIRALPPSVRRDIEGFLRIVTSTPSLQRGRRKRRSP